MAANSDPGPSIAKESANAGSGELAAMQAVLIGMNTDPEGRALLKRLNLDGFEPGGPALFDGVFGMYRAVSAN